MTRSTTLRFCGRAPSLTKAWAISKPRPWRAARNWRSEPNDHRQQDARGSARCSRPSTSSAGSADRMRRARWRKPRSALWIRMIRRRRSRSVSSVAPLRSARRMTSDRDHLRSQTQTHSSTTPCRRSPDAAPALHRFGDRPGQSVDDGEGNAAVCDRGSSAGCPPNPTTGYLRDAISKPRARPPSEAFAHTRASSGV